MKVVHRSDTLLVVEDRPWFFGLMLIAMALSMIFGGMVMVREGPVWGGAILVLIGGGVPILIAALMVQRVRLTLDRATGTLTRTMRSVRGQAQESYRLDRPRRAVVGVSTDSEGTTSRAELQLADPPQAVPFTTYCTNGKRPEAMVDAIND